jgi:hypothetical protein
VTSSRAARSFPGRRLAAFAMAGGIRAVAIVAGILATEIGTRRAKVSHPEVVAARRRAHANPQEEVR